MPSFTIQDLAHKLRGEITSSEPIVIDGVSSLSLATNNKIAGFYNLHQLSQLQKTKAGVVLTTSQLAKYSNSPTIIVKSVLETFELLVELFTVDSPPTSLGVNPKTVIDPTAKISVSAEVAPFVTVGKNCLIESQCSIGANSTIAENVKLGQGCKIGSNVTIGANTIIGDNVTIDAGCVIGAQPYSPKKKKGYWYMLFGAGRVIISDDVQLGANTTIDIGVQGDTIIGKNVIIDNLVQIGHDVIIDQHTVIAAGVMIGANTQVGQHCTIGGGSSFAGQLKIEEDIVITGMTTVTRSLKRPGIYSSGTTAQPHNIWRKNVARFHRLNLAIRQLRTVRKELEQLTKRVYK
jgi:UDP-3-O-[3-hydroxymyristoyl] glucosamine N-acyltransferase